MNRLWSVTRPTGSRRLRERRPAVALPVSRAAHRGSPNVRRGRLEADDRACSERPRGLICAVSEEKPGQGGGDRRDGRLRTGVMLANASFYEASRCQAPGDLHTFEQAPARSGLLMSRGGRGKRRRTCILLLVPGASCLPLAVRVASSSARLPSIRGDRSERSRTSCRHALDRGGKPLHLSNGSRHRTPETFASGSPPVEARATGAANP
jgi:hypothetical protein